MSSTKFVNAEFEIIEGDNRHIFIKVPKHLSNEDKEQYRKIRDEFISNIKNHKEYLKAHGITHKWVVAKIMSGMSFKELASIVMQFAMQDDFEQRRQEEVIDANENIDVAQAINQIKDADLSKEPLELHFAKGSLKYSDIKQAFADKIEKYEHISELTIQYKYYHPTKGLVTRSKPLATKEGLEFAHSLLHAYYLNETIDLNADPIKAVYSDTNADGESIPLTINMLTHLRVCHRSQFLSHFGTGVVIYSDNGGAFLKYKINPKFASSKYLCDKLLKYQVTNDLAGNMNLFKMNCLVYALSQTGIFSEAEIQSMMCCCFSKYISHKQLDDFGRDYHIKFYVYKYQQVRSTWKWKNIAHKVDAFIGDPNGNVKVRLILYHKHYFLDEEINGISMFAINHYDEIKKAHPDKSDEWIFTCTELNSKTGKFKSRPDRAKISSGDLVRLVTSDNIEFSFEEQYMMSSSL